MIFNDTINELFNRCFPIQQKQLSDKRIKKPWITSQLLKYINEGHRLAKLYRRNMLCPIIYKKYRNKLNSLIKQRKSDFFKDKFKNCMCDIKSTWNNLNKILKKKNVDNNDGLLIGGVAVTDTDIIASEFNHWLCSRK